MDKYTVEDLVEFDKLWLSLVTDVRQLCDGSFYSGPEGVREPLSDDEVREIVGTIREASEEIQECFALFSAQFQRSDSRAADIAEYCLMNRTFIEPTAHDVAREVLDEIVWTFFDRGPREILEAFRHCDLEEDELRRIYRQCSTKSWKNYAAFGPHWRGKDERKTAPNSPGKTWPLPFCSTCRGRLRRPSVKPSASTERPARDGRDF